jgi:hypothetical protein
VLCAPIRHVSVICWTAFTTFVFAGKLEGSASARDRSNGFATHVGYWASLNGFSQAFGIGFGYVRSTDFFSTIIVNNGLNRPHCVYHFVLRNLWLHIPGELVSICYKAGLFLVYLIMMATVPEFAYPSLMDLHRPRVCVAKSTGSRRLTKQPVYSYAIPRKMLSNA